MALSRPHYAPSTVAVARALPRLPLPATWSFSAMSGSRTAVHVESRCSTRTPPGTPSTMDPADLPQIEHVVPPGYSMRVAIAQATAQNAWLW